MFEARQVERVWSAGTGQYLVVDSATCSAFQQYDSSGRALVREMQSQLCDDLQTLAVSEQYPLRAKVPHPPKPFEYAPPPNKGNKKTSGRTISKACIKVYDKDLVRNGAVVQGASTVCGVRDGHRP